MSERVVHVTHHALDQAIARFGLRDMGSGNVARLIREDVAAALDEQRYATRYPAFALRPGTTVRAHGYNGGGQGGRNRSLRYCWSADEKRVYLIMRGDKKVVVITSIQSRRDTSGSQ